MWETRLFFSDSRYWYKGGNKSSILPIRKDVINMKPLSYEDRVRIQFDRFCKDVIRNSAKDIYKAMARQNVKESPIQDLTMDEQLQIAQETTYISATFKVCGFEITISDPNLAEGLNTLSEKNRNIILSYYFVGFNDSQIGKQYQLARTTILERRKRALNQLRKFMEEYESG